MLDNRLSVPKVVTLRAASGPLDADGVMRYAGSLHVRLEMDAGLLDLAARAAGEDVLAASRQSGRRPAAAVGRTAVRADPALANL